MDLYASDLGALEFRRLCGGSNNEDGEGEACVEIAPIPGTGDAFALRDAKRPEAGTLRFTRSELEAFQKATI